jgi:hypothetical protein
MAVLIEELVFKAIADMSAFDQAIDRSIQGLSQKFGNASSTIKPDLNTTEVDRAFSKGFDQTFRLTVDRGAFDASLLEVATSFKAFKTELEKPIEVTVTNGESSTRSTASADKDPKTAIDQAKFRQDVLGMKQSLSDAMDEAEERMSGMGDTKVVTPKFDFTNLHEFNTLMDIKMAHWGALKRTVEEPITPAVEDGVFTDPKEMMAELRMLQSLRTELQTPTVVAVDRTQILQSIQDIATLRAEASKPIEIKAEGSTTGKGVAKPEKVAKQKDLVGNVNIKPADEQQQFEKGAGEGAAESKGKKSGFIRDVGRGIARGIANNLTESILAGVLLATSVPMDYARSAINRLFTRLVKEAFEEAGESNLVKKGLKKAGFQISDLDSFEDKIEKSLQSALKKGVKKGVSDGISDGLSSPMNLAKIAMFQALSSLATRGVNAFFQSSGITGAVTSVSAAFGKQAANVGATAGAGVKTTADIVGTGIRQFSGKVGIDTLESFEDGNLTGLKRIEVIAKSMGNTAKKEFSEAGKKIQEAMGEFDLSNEVKKITSPVIDAIDRTLTTNRIESLKKDAIPLVLARANEISKKNSSINSGASVDKNTENLIITTGGYATARGLSGKRLTKLIKPEVGENDKVIWTQNTDSDIDKKNSKTLAGKAYELGKSLGKPNLRGYSLDAVEMASQAVAAIEKNPEIKIKFVGESGGGFAAEEAAKILELMGHKESSYIGVGTPAYIGGLQAKGDKILSHDDMKVGAHKNLIEKIGLEEKGSNTQNITGFTGHALDDDKSYHTANSAELQNVYKGAPKAFDDNELAGVKEAAAFFASVDTISLKIPELAQYAEMAFGNLQLVKRRLLVATGEEKKELQKISTSFESSYIKLADGDSRFKEAFRIIDNAKKIATESEKNPSLAVVQNSLVAVGQLQQMKKEIKTIQATPGTGIKKQSLIDAELNELIKRFESVSIFNNVPPEEGVLKPPVDEAPQDSPQGKKRNRRNIQRPDPTPAPNFTNVSNDIKSGESRLRDFQIQYIQELAGRAASLALDLQRLVNTQLPVVVTEISASQAGEVQQKKEATVVQKAVVNPASIPQEVAAANPIAPPKAGTLEEITGIRELTEKYQLNSSKQYQKFAAAAKPMSTIKGAKEISSAGINEVAQLYVGVKESSIRAIQALEIQAARLQEIVESSQDSIVVAMAKSAKIKVNQTKGQITKYATSTVLAGATDEESLRAAERNSLIGKTVGQNSKLQKENPEANKQLLAEIARLESHRSRVDVYTPDEATQNVAAKIDKPILSAAAQRIKNRRLGRQDADLEGGFLKFGGSEGQERLPLEQLFPQVAQLITSFKEFKIKMVRSRDEKRNAKQFANKVYPYAPAQQMPRLPEVPEDQDPMYNEAWGKYYDDRIKGLNPKKPKMIMERNGLPTPMNFQVAGLSPDERKEQMVGDYHNEFLERLNDEAIGHEASKSSFFGFFDKKTSTQDKTTPQRPKIDSLVSDFPEQLQEQQVNAFHSAIQKKMGKKSSQNDAGFGVPIQEYVKAINNKVGDLMDSVESAAINLGKKANKAFADGAERHQKAINKIPSKIPKVVAGLDDAWSTPIQKHQEFNFARGSVVDPVYKAKLIEDPWHSTPEIDYKAPRQYKDVLNADGSFRAKKEIVRPFDTKEWSAARTPEQRDWQHPEYRWSAHHVDSPEEEAAANAHLKNEIKPPKKQSVASVYGEVALQKIKDPIGTISSIIGSYLDGVKMLFGAVLSVVFLAAKHLWELSKKAGKSTSEIGSKIAQATSSGVESTARVFSGTAKAASTSAQKLKPTNIAKQFVLNEIGKGVKKKVVAVAETGQIEFDTLSGQIENSVSKFVAGSKVSLKKGVSTHRKSIAKANSIILATVDKISKSDTIPEAATEFLKNGQEKHLEAIATLDENLRTFTVKTSRFIDSGFQKHRSAFFNVRKKIKEIGVSAGESISDKIKGVETETTYKSKDGIGSAKQRMKDARTGNRGGTEGGWIKPFALISAINDKVFDLMDSVESRAKSVPNKVKSTSEQLLKGGKQSADIVRNALEEAFPVLPEVKVEKPKQLNKWQQFTKAFSSPKAALFPKPPEPEAPPDSLATTWRKRIGARVSGLAGQVSATVYPELEQPVTQKANRLDPRTEGWRAYAKRVFRGGEVYEKPIEPPAPQTPSSRLGTFGKRLFAGATNVANLSTEALESQGVPAQESIGNFAKAVKSIGQRFQSHADKVKIEADGLGVPTDKIISGTKNLIGLLGKLTPKAFDLGVDVALYPARAIKNSPTTAAKAAGGLVGVGLSAATNVGAGIVNFATGLRTPSGLGANIAGLTKDFVAAIPQLEEPIAQIKKIGVAVYETIQRFGGLQQVLSGLFTKFVVFTGITLAIGFINKFGEAATLASTQFDRLTLKADTATRGRGAALLQRSSETATKQGLDLDLVRDTNIQAQASTLGTSESGNTAQLIADNFRSAARAQGLNKDESRTVVLAAIDGLNAENTSVKDYAEKLKQGGYVDAYGKLAEVLGTDQTGLAGARGLTEGNLTQVDKIRLSQAVGAEAATKGDVVSRSQEASLSRLETGKKVALEGLGDKLKAPEFAVEGLAAVLKNANVIFETFTVVVAAAFTLLAVQGLVVLGKLTIAFINFGAATLTAGNAFAFTGIAVRAAGELIVKTIVGIGRAVAPILLLTLAIEALGRSWNTLFGKGVGDDFAQSIEETANKTAQIVGRKPVKGEGTKTDEEVKNENLTPDWQTKTQDWLIRGFNKLPGIDRTNKIKDGNFFNGGLTTAAEGEEIRYKNRFYDRILPGSNTVLADAKTQSNDVEKFRVLADLKERIAINKEAQSVTTNSAEDQAKRKQLIQEGGSLQAKFAEADKPMADMIAAITKNQEDLQKTKDTRILPGEDKNISGLIYELEKTKSKLQSLGSAVSEVSIAFNKAAAALARQDRLLDQSKSRIGIAAANDRIASTIARRNEEDDYTAPERSEAAGIADQQRQISALEIDMIERKKQVATLKKAVGPEFEPLDPTKDKEKFDKVKKLEAEVIAKNAEANKLFRSQEGDDNANYEKGLKLKNEALRAEQEAQAIRASKPNTAVDQNKLKELQGQEDKILQMTQEYADKRASIEEARLAKEIADEKRAVEEIDYYYNKKLGENRVIIANEQAALVPIVAGQSKTEFGERESRSNLVTSRNSLAIEEANRKALQKLIDDEEIGLTKSEVDTKILDADTKIAEARKAVLEAEKNHVLAITATAVRQMEIAQARIEGITQKLERDNAVAASRASRAAISPVNLKQSFLAIDISDTVQKLQTLKNEASAVATSKQVLSIRKDNLSKTLSPESYQELQGAFQRRPEDADVAQLSVAKALLEGIKDPTAEGASQLSYIKERLDIDKLDVEIEAKKTSLASSINQAQKDVQSKMKQIYEAQAQLAGTIISDNTALTDELRKTSAEIKQGSATNKVKRSLLGITGFMSDFADGILSLIEAASAIGNDQKERSIQNLRSKGKYNQQLDQNKQSAAQVIAESKPVFDTTSQIGIVDGVGTGSQPTIYDRHVGDGKLKFEGETPEYTGQAPRGAFTSPNLGFAQKVSTGYQVDVDGKTAQDTVTRRTSTAEPVRAFGANGEALITSVNRALVDNSKLLTAAEKKQYELNVVKFEAALISFDNTAIKIKRDLSETVRGAQTTTIANSFTDRELQRSSRRTNYIDQAEAGKDETIKSFLAEQKTTDDEIRQLEGMLAKAADVPAELEAALKSNEGVIGANAPEIQARIASFGDDTDAGRKAIVQAVEDRKARRATLSGLYQGKGLFAQQELRDGQVEKIDQLQSNSQTSYLREKAGVEGTDKYEAARLTGQAALIENEASFKKGLRDLQKELISTNLAGTAAGNAIEANFKRINEIKLDKIRNEINVMTGQISSALTGEFTTAILSVGDVFSKAFERLTNPERFKNVQGGIRGLGDSLIDTLKALGQGILGTLAKISAEAAAASISKWATKGLTGFMNGILGISTDPAAKDTPAIPQVEVAPAKLEIPQVLQSQPTAIVEIHKAEAAINAAKQQVAETTQVVNTTLPQATPLPQVFNQSATKAPVSFADQIARQQEEGLPAFRPVEPTTRSIYTPPIVLPVGKTEPIPEPISTPKSWRSPLVEMDFGAQVPAYTPPVQRIEATPGSNVTADPATDVKGWVVPPPEKLVEAGQTIGEGIVQKLQASESRTNELLAPLPTGQDLGGQIGKGQSFVIEQPTSPGLKDAEKVSKVDIVGGGEVIGAGLAKSLGGNIAATAAKGGNVGESVLKQGASLAGGYVAKSVTNLIGDALGSIFKFDEGGMAGEHGQPIEIFARGGVAGYSSEQIERAIAAEGEGAMLGVIHRGEIMVSRKTGDADILNSLIEDGTWAERKANKAAVYAAGGVGGGASGMPNGGGSRSGGSSAPTHVDNSMTINVHGMSDQGRDQIGYNQDQIELRQQRANARNQQYRSK